MSAIYGLLRFGGRPVLDAELRVMDTALAGLGPDDQGRWCHDGIGLGRRGMWFTPEDAFEQQPLSCAGRRLQLVCDGRIDNRAELAAALGIPGAELRGLPESALVLRAYERWGEDCPARLVGSFVFAVWDAPKRQLFLARSPLTGGPLHYHQASDGSFAFATMPRGLFALPGIPRGIDAKFLADHLLSMPPDAGHCFYGALRQLPLGHCLRVTATGLELRRHWHPDRLPPLRYARDEDYREAARALLDRSVADAMRSRSPVAVMMSGGLDSTAIAGTAAQQQAASGLRLQTFTEVPAPALVAATAAMPAGRYADETPQVLAMARRHGNLDPHFVHGGGFYLDDIESLFAIAEIPFRNASNRSWWEACLSGAAGRGARVVLTGIGGNLSLGWNGSDLIETLLRGGRWRAALAAARQDVRAGQHRSVPRALARGLMPLAPFALARWRQRRALGAGLWPDPRIWQRHSPISEALVCATDAEVRCRDKGYSLEHACSLDTFERRVRALEIGDPTMNLDRGYRQRFGVDSRHPAYDRRLVEFSLSIPPEPFRRGGIPRSLLRSVVADRVPEEVRHGRGRGLQAAHWLQYLQAASSRVEHELQLLERSPSARQALDLRRLRKLSAALGTVDASDLRVMADYRTFLERGLMTGRFLRWVESQGHVAG